MSIDLISLVLSLKALASPPAEQIPSWWGRAAHSLFLKTMQQYDPALSAALHAPPDEDFAEDSSPAVEFKNPQATRPFTVSSLLGRFVHKQLDPAAEYMLRFSGLHASVSQILLSAAQSGPLQPGKTVELDHIQFLISAVQYDRPVEAGNPAVSPWAGNQSYADLSADLLLAKKPAPRRITLLFTSPTTFKSKGKHVPVPLPELVFGSLLERWNQFAPITFPAETHRYAEECLALSRYELSTRPAPVKSGGIRVGAIGEATYATLHYDRYWMSVIGTLAEFALYSGVGAGTTSGLGQCRQIQAEAGEKRFMDE